jgi:hypothetical protein
MGHSRTCNLELQIDIGDKLLMVGAQSKRDAINQFRSLAPLYKATIGYLWAQTAQGRRIIRDTDYLVLELRDNDVIMSGRDVEEDSSNEI